MNEIYLAGGCFWGVEKYFSLKGGVISTEVGYANGHVPNPSYDEVCSGTTGHVEAVKIGYRGQLDAILDFFYKIIDPTAVNKQGPDTGPQYRTGIYYQSREDKLIAEASLKKLQEEYSEPIAVELLPLASYYKAEEYHQKYLDKNPDGYCHIPSYMLEP